MLTRLLNVRAENKGGKLRFKITDESKDRHGTIIKMDGWDFSAFINNPTIFYQHLSFTDNPDHALGFGEILKGDDGYYMDATLEPEDLNPLAHKIGRKVDFGTLSMVSVGFNPSDWSFGIKEKGEDPETLYFRKQELLEVSIVHIGSNKNAHNKDMVDQENIGDFVRLAKQDRDKANLPEEKKPVEVIEEKIIEAVKKLDEHQSRLLRLRVQSL